MCVTLNQRVQEQEVIGMKLNEYMKTQNTTEGFPQGDTLLDLNIIDFSDFEFIDDNGKSIKRSKLKNGYGKEFYCPRSVLKDLQVIAEAGGRFVRVTRVGTTKDNTRYTTVRVESL